MRLRILVGVILNLTSVASHCATFTLLGSNVFSEASAVSADGSTVVGDSIGSAGRHAFRWTAGQGMADLGTLPGTGFGGESYAHGVSADGSVVTGVSDGYPDYGAFRWTATGMVALGHLPDHTGPSRAYAISYDGSVIVGSDDQVAGVEAFRWTSTGGMVGLGDLPGGPFASVAYGVSGDGSAVVGSSTVSDDFRYEAFKWTAADGMVSLGDVPGEGDSSSALAASFDGSVVVGVGNAQHGGPEAFRWTAAGGMVGLGDLPGGNFDSRAQAVSADGSVIVGTGHTLNGPGGNSTEEAFIWTAGGGMKRLLDILVAQGATGLDGWLLINATGISADGTTIVGMAEREVDGFPSDMAYVVNIAPVPVPAVGWLLAPAFGVLMRRRGSK